MSTQDTVYIGCNGHVCAVRIEDGVEVWRTELESGFLSVTGHEDVSALVDGGRVYAGCHGHLFCLDARTCRQICAQQARWPGPQRGHPGHARPVGAVHHPDRVVARVKPPLQSVVRRTLVCLPGMDGSALMFRPLVEAAPPDVEVVTIGYPPGPANTYQQLLPQVQAALPDARPYYLLGWSFSGPMALLVAATRPPLLRGVVLASSFATAPVRYLPRWIPPPGPTLDLPDVSGDVAAEGVDGRVCGRPS